MHNPDELAPKVIGGRSGAGDAPCVPTCAKPWWGESVCSRESLRFHLGITSALAMHAVKPLISHSALATVASLLFACGPASTSAEGLGRDNCPVTPAARQLLEGLIRNGELELEFVTTQSGPQEAASLWWLIGTDAGSQSNAHLVLTCSASRTDGETCQPNPNWPLTPCFRTGCEAAGVAFTEVYATEPPHQGADDRISVSYDSEAPYPAGRITYNPNPLTHWRLDYTQAAVVSTSASFQRAASAVLPNGDHVDLSYNAQFAGTHSMSGDAFTTNLLFGQLSWTGAVKVSVKNGSNGPLSGVIERGNEVLATMTQANLKVIFSWQSICSN
jgi:hypothetical protein